MAKYYLQKQNKLVNMESAAYRARFDHSETVTTADMLQHISQHRTGRPAEIQAALATITDYIVEQMQEGNTVRLEGLGEFTPALAMESCKEVTRNGGSESYVQVEGLHVDAIHFKADASLMADVNRDFHATRSNRPVHSNSKPDAATEEQRKAKVREFLQTNASMRLCDYVQMTGFHTSTASAELKRWASAPDGFLTSKGLSTHKVYVLR